MPTSTTAHMTCAKWDFSDFIVNQSDLNISSLASLILSLSHCPKSLSKAGSLFLKSLLSKLIQLSPVTYKTHL